MDFASRNIKTVGGFGSKRQNRQNCGGCGKSVVLKLVEAENSYDFHGTHRRAWRVHSQGRTRVLEIQEAHKMKAEIHGEV